MDTLYLVFKHRFQIVIWICLTEAKTSPQANEDFNPLTPPCQAPFENGQTEVLLRRKSRVGTLKKPSL
jgi:hypothetical protein